MTPELLNAVAVPQFISLGAGVQSSTMALLAADGAIAPSPVAAIFADTMAEPRSVYSWLDQLKTMLPYPVICVSAGNLRSASTSVRVSRNGRAYVPTSIPGFVGQSLAPMMRQCTRDYKIRPIMRAVRRVLSDRGLPKRAVQWIGISTDEVMRIKPSRERWTENRWPLIELNMSRGDCVAYLAARGLKAPRSACAFCPFHSDAEWSRLKREEPDTFAAVVEYEREMQSAFSRTRHLDGVPWLHRSGLPIGEAVDSKVNQSQMSLWGNECEGVCGV